MATLKKKHTEGVTKRKKKVRKKFLAVDVWKKEFGPVAVRAVYDVFQTKFNIESHNMRKYSFSHCVNELRALEDEDYVKPRDISSY